jgi:amino acid adenylation domain-containing protein
MNPATPNPSARRPEHAFSRLTPEQASFLRQWNDTARDYPRDATIPALFEEQARRRPEAVALVWAPDGATWTYDALNQRANRLAHRLEQFGVRSEARVALRLDRSIDMIVAMLAVLKAGGAYVPLDPSLPLKRTAFLLEDAGPSVIVTTEALADGLPATWLPIVSLDSDAGEIARQSQENLPPAASPLGLAHILYTSGSTGEPKGVAVLHRGVVRLVRGTDYAGFGEDEVFLQAAPASFDASTFEIWGPLLNGGRLVVLPAGTPSLDAFAAAIRRHGVTTLWLTAGLFHLAVDERLEDLKPLRQLLAGGDVLLPTQVRRVLRDIPSCRLINGYGPTEGTTFSACHRIERLEPDAATVPIGRPIAQTQIYLLDEEGRWVPPGETGELFIGGDGVARGYWNRPQLTAETFVESPFDAEPGARLYRTGDLARLRPDGTLEFLGRRDQQIKLQGFRVELSEVEAALARHPAVAQAAADARTSVSGSRRLVAYVVLGKDGTCDEGVLRAFLQRELPDYMIPGSFVFLPSLPLTANGKIDRRSLPDPGRAVAEKTAVPGSAMEESIAAVWRDVLGLPAMDLDGNFFDLGGSSLLLIEAHSRLQKRLGRSLPITALFESPTVRALARSLGGDTAPYEALRSLRERIRNRRRPGLVRAEEPAP